MTWIALAVGLLVFFAFQIGALLFSRNVRRLWRAMLRLYLLVVLVGLPWLIAWLYPQAYQPSWAQGYPNLAWLLSWLIPVGLMVCMAELVKRLRFLPFMNVDPTDDRSPVLAVTLLPLVAALAGAGLALAVVWGYTWLFVESHTLLLPVISP